MSTNAINTEERIESSPVSKRILAILGDIKFAHSIFALPFALIAAHLAFNSIGGYRWNILLAILICMVSARTAAMSFNRFLDRDIDLANPRTSRRSIPSGQAKPIDAMIIVGACSVLFIGACIYLGFWPTVLSVPTLAFLLGYSAAKRYTTLTHLWLGFALAISPTGAWVAITGEWKFLPMILSIAVMSWVAGFDIIYSLQDIEFDKENRVFSIPAQFGVKNALWIGRVLHFISFAGLVWFGYSARIGVPWNIASLLVGILLIIEHSLIRENDLSKVGIAFFTINGIISVVLYISVLISSVAGGQH